MSTNVTITCVRNSLRRHSGRNSLLHYSVHLESLPSGAFELKGQPRQEAAADWAAA